MTTSVARALAARAGEAAHRPRTACTCASAAGVLADRHDGTVVRHGDTVAKAHASDADRAALDIRLAVAAHPALTGILLPPLDLPRTELDGRPVTFWPHGTPVDPETPDAAPWEAAATLLARLHATPLDQLPGPLPEMRGPTKAALAVARMRRTARAHPAATAVERAWATLPAWARAEAPMPYRAALCHGDMHLGQVVRHPASGGRWQLIDVDDLGLGHPAWDLARPAAWYAAGLLPTAEWTRFLGAYRAAHGPALPATGIGDGGAGDWDVLDLPARALTAQTAALAVAKSVTENRPLDEVEQALIDACDRIATLPPAPACDPPK